MLIKVRIRAKITKMAKKYFKFRKLILKNTLNKIKIINKINNRWKVFFNIISPFWKVSSNRAGGFKKLWISQ